MELLKWLDFVGRAICHQLPERSFVINGIQMPICARDTGIYVGIFSSILVLVIMKKHKVNMIPKPFVSMCLLLFMAPMAFDGLTSYLDLRESNNVLRIITGLLFGSVLPMFVIPLINIRKKQKVKDVVIPRFYEFFVAIAIAFGVSMIFFTSLIHAAVLSLFLIITVIIWFSLLIMLLLKLLGWHPFTFHHAYISIGLSIFCLSMLSLLFKYI